MTMRRPVAIAAALFLACASAHADPADIRSQRIPLYPSRPGDTRAGVLIYRGGLDLNSNDARFGGWSDLAVSADGTRLLAISDRGNWLRAKLGYDANGNIAGASDADIAPVLDPNGQPVTGRNADSEGLTLERAGDVDGPAILSFEGNVRVWRYDFTKGANARPTRIAVGPWVLQLHTNQQLEAITLWNPDTLILFGETKVAPGDDLLGAMEAYPGAARPRTRMLSAVPHDPFAITSVANAPDGGLFLLERRFSLLGGVGTELRHIPAAAIKPGARLDGSVLMNLSFQDANIDNMEGVAVRKGARGETLLYLISDGNFSPIQRTLLLMFEVKAEA
jgi:hypothetical protein